MKKILFTAGLLLSLAMSASALTADEIMDKVIDTQTADSSALDIIMNLQESNGETSQRRLQTLMCKSDGETKTITIFLEPARVKNTRFLTISHKDRADDQWIYLPALRKVKRIAAGEQEGSFMGSDFSYSDMSSGNLSDDNAKHTLLREEQLDGYDCYVVESLPGSDSTYAKTVVWADKKTWLTVKVEFYRKSDSSLQKLLRCSDFTQNSGRWYAATTVMETVETGHKTILEIKQVKYGIKIDPGYFSTRFLETGRM
ncbi:MAG: outer membrane lipoprotein-sorting protein [Spirochaetales bacterium]|nr:outer membrane lipoprotein-sorting protein [Spirochaetales bacterium]